jgi:putative SOS response-associated peptidase YedK
LRTPATVLIEQFDLDVRADEQLALFEPRYNIAPTQDVVVVRSDAGGGRRTASMMRWGLLPSWSKGVASGAPMINARSETLAEKPAFRSAFRSRRCLIPADGFYEWQQSASGAKGKKQPFWIHRPDGGPFAFAGLWEKWRGDLNSKAGQAEPSPDPSLKGRGNSEGGVESCTIVTTGANAALSELHDRMPVILAPGDYALWLDPNVSEPGQLQHLLAPCGDDELLAEPVSTHVNRVANDDPRCIEAERTLF